MRKLLNTLFVTSPGTYVHIDHDTVKLEKEKETVAKLPILHFSSVVIVGDIMVSPAALTKFAEEGRQVIFLDRNGRFLARVEGAETGNILLRQAQFRALECREKCVDIARWIVAGKLRNCRNILMRGFRDSLEEESAKLLKAADRLKQSIAKLKDETALEVIRGIEGDAAKIYYRVFSLLLKEAREDFSMQERSRRPPRDRINALLSFLYTLLMHDYRSALLGVGLDTQAGYLHSLRSGRPALALELMEEFRPWLADRLALTLINRKQINAGHFTERKGGAVYLSDKGRKEVIIAYQKRKQDEVSHPLLKEKPPLGLIPHIQARIFARYIRGDIETYTPYTPK